MNVTESKQCLWYKKMWLLVSKTLFTFDDMKANVVPHFLKIIGYLCKLDRKRQNPKLSRNLCKLFAIFVNSRGNVKDQCCPAFFLIIGYLYKLKRMRQKPMLSPIFCILFALIVQNRYKIFGIAVIFKLLKSTMHIIPERIH